MGSLQNIVNVQITRETTAPTRAGFGTGAFLASDAAFAGRIKEYGSYQEVLDDDFAGAQATAAAAVYFGQDLSPTKLTVIKKGTADQSQIDDLVFSAALITGNSIVVTLDGVALTAVPFNTDNATTLTDIAAAIQADASVTTAVSDGTDTITVTWADEEIHTISAVVTGGASQATAAATRVQNASTNDTITEALTDAIDQNNDWYGLGIWSRADADILETSSFIQGIGSTNPKLFFAQSDDATILDPTITVDIASQVQALARFRTSVWYHSLDAEYLDMGMLGGQLPTDPGSIQWAYKTVSSVTPDDLTDSQKNAAFAKAANTYTTIAGVNITEQGKVSDSPFEWIDVIRGVDWLTVNIAADLFEVLVNTPKLPYTTNGLGVVKSTILNRLRIAQGQGILTTDSDPVVTVPDITSIPNTDKANRVLNNVTFRGILAGAVIKINVNGTVSLS